MTPADPEPDRRPASRGPQRTEVAAVPAGERPVDPTPRHTEDLPDTPQRTRTIAASAWIEAPQDLHDLGLRFGGPNGLDPDSVAGMEASFLRRIGPWLLWRAGPSRQADASYWAAKASDPDQRFTFALFPDGTGDGSGPSGTGHTRFRAWKEDLRDHD